MKSVAYPLRIPENIMNLAQVRAKEEYVDKSTALRQLLHIGAEEYTVSLIETGRVTIGRAAEILNISIQDIHRIAEKHGIRLGASFEQGEKSRKIMKKLIKKF